MHRRKLWLVPYACFVSVLCLFNAAGSARAAEPVPAAVQSDFSDFLLTRDLVVRGTIVRVERVQRERTSGCGAIGLGPIAGRLITVHADSVILGSLQSRAVQVFSYDDRREAAATDVPGKRVLLYGLHPCDDPLMLYGDIAAIERDGSMIVPEGESIVLQGARDSHAPRVSEVLGAVEHKRARRGDMAFEGARAVALVKITNITKMDRGYAGTPELVRWIAGAPGPVPSTILFAAVPQCGGVTAGETLLLPIPAEFTGGNLSVAWCSERLVVRDGRVPGLSTHLDHLADVLVSRNGRLHVITERGGR